MSGPVELWRLQLVSRATDGRWWSNAPRIFDGPDARGHAESELARFIAASRWPGHPDEWRDRKAELASAPFWGTAVSLQWSTVAEHWLTPEARPVAEPVVEVGEMEVTLR